MREDMVIENVEFTSEKSPSWINLPRKKQIAVEQFLRDELTRLGMDCGNISEKFSKVILADVVPSVEP
jgi:hypothetical protein